MPQPNVVPLRSLDLDDAERDSSPSRRDAPELRVPIRFDQRLRVLSATAFEALIVVDDERRYLRVNEAATRVLGAPADRIIGRQLEDFTPQEHWPQLERLWKQFRRDGELEGPYEVLQGDGKRQPIAFRAYWHFALGEHLIAAIEMPFSTICAPAEEKLTNREREILTLAAQGLSNQAIADCLVVSPATVKTHLQNIYAKLQVHDRAGAVALALRSRLIT